MHLSICHTTASLGIDSKYPEPKIGLSDERMLEQQRQLQANDDGDATFLSNISSSQHRELFAVLIHN